MLHNPVKISSSVFHLGLLCFNFSITLSYAFDVYWNIPTFMCRQYNINFENLIRKFEIIVNKNDDFRGDKIAILYDPGNFSAILQGQNKWVYRNGGVPQEGNLKLHLKAFAMHVNQLINKDFTGLGVIDFESWRPIFDQNFGVLKPYKDYSIEIEKQKHPSSNEKKLKIKAAKRFEAAGKEFMAQTLRLAQKLRPLASFGYYIFPYCFIKAPNKECNIDNQKQNDATQWIYDKSDVIFPSVYLQQATSREVRLNSVRAKVNEALRLVSQVKREIKPKIFVYHRSQFTDTRNYLSELEQIDVLMTIRNLIGSDGGIVLWGSSDDLKSREKCESFYSYLNDTLGPVVQSIKGRSLVMQNALAGR